MTNRVVNAANTYSTEFCIPSSKSNELNNKALAILVNFSHKGRIKLTSICLIIFLNLFFFANNVYAQRKYKKVEIDTNSLSNKEFQNKIIGKYTAKISKTEEYSVIIGPSVDGKNLEFLFLSKSNALKIYYGVLELATQEYKGDKELVLSSRIQYIHGEDYPIYSTKCIIISPRNECKAMFTYLKEYRKNEEVWQLPVQIGSRILNYDYYGNSWSLWKPDDKGYTPSLPVFKRDSKFKPSNAAELLNKYRPNMEIEFMDDRSVYNFSAYSFDEKKSNANKSINKDFIGRKYNPIKFLIRNQSVETLYGMNFKINTPHSLNEIIYKANIRNDTFSFYNNQKISLPPINANDSLILELLINPLFSNKIDSLKFNIAFDNSHASSSFYYPSLMNFNIAAPYMMDDYTRLTIKQNEKIKRAYKKKEDKIANKDKFVKDWEKNYKLTIPSPEYSAMKFFVDSLYNPEEGLKELIDYDKGEEMDGTLWLAFLSDLKLIHYKSPWFWRQKAIAITDNGRLLDSSMYSINNTQDLMFKAMIAKFNVDILLNHFGKFHDVIKYWDQNSRSYPAERSYPPAIYWLSYYSSYDNLIRIGDKFPEISLIRNKSKYKNAYNNLICSIYLDDCNGTLSERFHHYDREKINKLYKTDEWVSSIISNSENNNAFLEFCKGLYHFKKEEYSKMKNPIEALHKNNTNDPLRIGYAAELAMRLYGANYQLSEQDELMIKSSIDLAENQGLSSALVLNAYIKLLNTNSNSIPLKEYENILKAAICGNIDAILLMIEICGKENTNRYHAPSAIAWKNYLNSVTGKFQSFEGQSWWSSYFNNFSVKYNKTQTTTYINGQYQGAETSYSPDILGSYFDAFLRTREEERAQKQPLTNEFKKFDFGDFYIVQGNVMGTTTLNLKLYQGNRIQTVVSGVMTTGLPTGTKYNPVLNPPISEVFKHLCVSPIYPYMNLIYNIDGAWKGTLPNKIEKETIIKEITVNDTDFINNYGYYTFTIFVFK